MTNAFETSADETLVIRQLALVDRIIGLEAEVANLRSVNVSREVKTQINLVKSSTTWRVGSIVLAPLFMIKRLIARGGARGVASK